MKGSIMAGDFDYNYYDYPPWVYHLSPYSIPNYIHETQSQEKVKLYHNGKWYEIDFDGPPTIKELENTFEFTTVENENNPEQKALQPEGE